jgi:hypothetical protein
MPCLCFHARVMHAATRSRLLMLAHACSCSRGTTSNGINVQLLGYSAIAFYAHSLPFPTKTPVDRTVLAMGDNLGFSTKKAVQSD